MSLWLVGANPTASVNEFPCNDGDEVLFYVGYSVVVRTSDCDSLRASSNLAIQPCPHRLEAKDFRFSI